MSAVQDLPEFITVSSLQRKLTNQLTNNGTRLTKAKKGKTGRKIRRVKKLKKKRKKKTKKERKEN